MVCEYIINKTQRKKTKYLTNGVNFIHKNNARLMISSKAEHFPDQSGTLADIFIHNSTGNRPLKRHGAVTLDIASGTLG